MSDARMPPLNSGYFVDVRTRRDVRRYPNPLDGSAVDRRWVGSALAAPTATHENRPS
ncbi:hypothetical protein NX871_07040 [Burkholderia thailandensis]|uniref:hypothetical protein n=1 Tax=Burkholderia thailandensis TaxID=57975 RepID=UPI00217D6BC3|nr:hypothetical protein [Burkholderia thailandensis]MCS6469717.1 hypothetical protein [Burkholderia thailandensis]